MATKFRAVWDDAPVTAAELLALYDAEGPLLAGADLDRIDELKRTDAPPEDKCGPASKS